MQKPESVNREVKSQYDNKTYDDIVISSLY